MERVLKILIVEDDDLTRGLYAEVFKKHGFEVEEAVDGADGLDKAVKNVPNVILTGIVMPNMGGFSLIEALKKNEETSGVSVAISSHMGREEDRKKAEELGVKDFISRDINTPNEVVERIKSILNMTVYNIKFYPAELDAEKMAKDMHFNEKLQCADCGGDAILTLTLKDVNSHEFSARFVCSKCGKAQK